MTSSILKRQVLKVFLLIRNNDIGDVGLCEGMFGNSQQAVGISG